VTAEVEAANTALYEALESADVDRMASVWDDVEPAALVCVHPGWPMLRGRAHVLRWFSAILANTPYSLFFLTYVLVAVTGYTAVVTCTENILTAVSQEGSSGEVVATNVFVRRPDGWRLQVHHGSPVLGTLEEVDDDGE
jgi:ketosteroid isomerase-like protein